MSGRNKKSHFLRERRIYGVFSADEKHRHDLAWQKHTAYYEQTYRPNLWVTFETIQPVTDPQKLEALVQTFWRKVCQKYKVEAWIDCVTDISPKAIEDKYHSHCIVRIDGKIPSRSQMTMMWLGMINKHLFGSNHKEKISKEELASKAYALNVQPYEQRATDCPYNRCDRYALVGHEWQKVYCVDKNDKAARRKRREQKLYDGSLPTGQRKSTRRANTRAKKSKPSVHRICVRRSGLR